MVGIVMASRRHAVGTRTRTPFADEARPWSDVDVEEFTAFVSGFAVLPEEMSEKSGKTSRAQTDDHREGEENDDENDGSRHDVTLLS